VPVHRRRQDPRWRAATGRLFPLRAGDILNKNGKADLDLPDGADPGVRRACGADVRRSRRAAEVAGETPRRPIINGGWGTRVAKKAWPMPKLVEACLSLLGAPGLRRGWIANSRLVFHRRIRCSRARWGTARPDAMRKIIRSALDVLFSARRRPVRALVALPDLVRASDRTSGWSPRHRPVGNWAKRKLSRAPSGSRSSGDFPKKKRHVARSSAARGRRWGRERILVSPAAKSAGGNRREEPQKRPVPKHAGPIWKKKDPRPKKARASGR